MPPGLRSPSRDGIYAPSMSPPKPVAALALAALLAGCSPYPGYALRVAASSPAACTFRGRWAYGELLGARSRVAFADVSDAAAEGALLRGPDGPSLRLHLRTHGWNLLGLADLSRGHALRPRRAITLTELLTAHAGADISVRDARPGEALIAPGPFAFGSDEGEVRFVVDPARWVPCSELGFEFTFRDEHTEERERAAMGLATTLPPREIAGTASVDLAATPGGSPQVHFNPRNYGLTVRPISTDGAFTRVLLQHWTSFAIVGWLPTAALSDEGSGGYGGILGGLGSSNRRALTVCRSPVDLTFGFVRPQGPIEYAGSVAAGTPFIRGAATPDGGFEISSHPRGSSPRPASGVRWVAHAIAQLSCRDVVE